MFKYARVNVSMIFTVLVLSVNPVYAQVTFNSKNYTLSHAPQSAVSADLNGDGKPDLVIASQTGGTVAVLLNNGDGTFSPELDFPAIPNFFNGIAVGDFNGDKKLDVLAVDSGDSNTGTAPALYVLLGNGNGTLQPPVSTSLAFLSQVSAFIGVGDFNGDGETDVALYAYDGTNLGPTALLSNGDGTFSPGSVVSTGGLSVLASVVADLNGDGKLDLALSFIDANNAGSLLAFLGNGDGTFQSPSQALPPQSFWMLALAAGDFSHRGKPDLVSTSYQEESCPFGACRPVGPAGALAVLPQSGNGSFGAPSVVLSGNYGLSAAGDFDGDGNLDIAAFGVASRHSASPSVIMLGDGKGAFPGQSPTTFGTPSSALSGDFNGDGLSDLATINSGVLQVALNTTPGFSLSASSSGPPISPGGSATYNIDIGQQNGFTGAVTLTCSAPGNEGIACSVSPSSATPGGSSTLTVTTTGMSGVLVRPGFWHGWMYAFWLPLGAVVFCMGDRRAGRKSLRGMLLGLIFLVGCSGQNSPNVHATPSGSYKIGITGSSGALQRSTTATVTVN